VTDGNPSWYRWEQNHLLLQLRIQPGAGRNEFVSPLGDHYKVRIAAPPVDGKANAQLLKFLAKTFGVRRGNVSLVSGTSTRSKRVRIEEPVKIPLPMAQVEHTDPEEQTRRGPSAGEISID